MSADLPERTTYAPPAPSDRTPPLPLPAAVQPNHAAPAAEGPPRNPLIDVVDQLGDIVGLVCITWLAGARLITGEAAMGMIIAILGLQNGIRRLGRRGVGALGVTILALGSLAASPAAHALATHATSIPSPHPDRMTLPGMVLAIGLLLGGCSGARSRGLELDPLTPPRRACVVGEGRCGGSGARAGRVPEQCDRDEPGSDVTRFWATTPRAPDGEPAPCAVRCVVDGRGAHCAG